MKRTNINSRWEFTRGYGASFSLEQPQLINLPHDCMISLDVSADTPAGGANGYYPGCSGAYVKKLVIPKEWAGERILLEIDGAYMNSEVFINEQLAARRPYGYSPYHADLTPYIQYGGENEIKIRVNTGAVPNSRWYSGAGVYRHVDLLRGGSIHIAPWGIYAVTEYIDNGDAMLRISVSVENHKQICADARIAVQIKDPNGDVVLTGTALATVPAGGQGSAQIRMLLENAHLWDLNDPYLYTVHAKLDGDSPDSDEATFGVRTVSVDAKNGFRLNGNTIKLKGGCIHHDNGILGSAAFDAAEYRKVLLHKQNGFNALRSAHNPPSRGLLDACDRLGILVIDEAFDMWNVAKNPHDYHLYFNEWWRSDIDAMVLRDRNHPSVIMWSIGNEIPEHGGDSDGWLWSQRLSARVRELDSTRPVTSAVNNVQPPFEKMLTMMSSDFTNGFTFVGPVMQQYNREHFFDLTEGYCATLDVVGYNYIDYLYEQTSTLYPHRVLCGTESFPLEADLQWDMVERMPNLIGDFTWTSFDYIGEAGIGKVDYTEPGEEKSSGWGGSYPWRLANDADFDICGFERPQLHYRKIVWGSKETYIAVYNPANNGKTETISLWGWPDVENRWTWTGYEGKPTTIDVYSAFDEVELYVNGVSAGRKPAGKANRYKAVFETVYAPGEIVAVSYADGREVSRDAVKTVGKPVSLCLSAEEQSMKANGQDLCYVAVEVTDADGMRVPGAEYLLTASVKGAASLAAFGSSAPVTTENYTSGSFTTFGGRLLAILRADEEGGSATLTVESETFEAVSIQIDVYKPVDL